MGPRFFEPHHFGGFYWGHFLLSLLFIGALVALGVWLIRSGHQHSHHGAPPVPPPGPPVDPALHEARMRYARGEMNRAEFLKVSADLAQPGPPETPMK